MLNNNNELGLMRFGGGAPTGFSIPASQPSIFKLQLQH